MLIFGVFATNFVVGGFHASYERFFVKKIQHFCALKEQERNDTSLAPFALTARPLVIYRLPMVLPWAIFLLGLRPVFARNHLLVYNVLKYYLLGLRPVFARNINCCTMDRRTQLLPLIRSFVGKKQPFAFVSTILPFNNRAAHHKRYQSSQLSIKGLHAAKTG